MCRLLSDLESPVATSRFHNGKHNNVVADHESEDDGVFDSSYLLAKLVILWKKKVIGSAKNGNYLGILDPLSEFDPFLEEPLKLKGNPGTGSFLYLAANVCKEFIKVMGRCVHCTILE